MKHSFIITLEFAENEVTAQKVAKALRKAAKTTSVEVASNEPVGPATQEVTPVGVKLISIGEQ